MDRESVQDRRYAPPVAHVEDVAPPETGPLQLATRSQRFWAAMLDAGIAFGAVILVSALAPALLRGGDADSGLWSLDLRGAAVGYLIFLALHGVLLVRRGQTLGKAVLRIRIRRSDGGPASAFSLLGIRYGVGAGLMTLPVLGAAYGVLDALLIFRRSRRCLHDTLADTIVVQA